MITAFRGRWTRLGNYSACTVFYKGHAYPSVEHAYQAQKTTDPALQREVRLCATPQEAKKVARSLPLRPDWEEVKVDIMRTLLREKFSQEPECTILLSTGDHILIEGNWWHDNFWGICSCGKRPACNGGGMNMLGMLLMQLRNELAHGESPIPESERFIPEE